MVYVIVQVVVSSDSRFIGIRNRTGGRVTRQQVKWNTLSFKWSCHQTTCSMVYVIVEVVVSPDSKIDGLRNRTGGRVIRQKVQLYT